MPTTSTNPAPAVAPFAATATPITAEGQALLADLVARSRRSRVPGSMAVRRGGLPPVDEALCHSFLAGAPQRVRWWRKVA